MRLRRKPPIFRSTLGRFGSRAAISDRNDELSFVSDFRYPLGLDLTAVFAWMEHVNDAD
jgi:hypothetical protein